MPIINEQDLMDIPQPTGRILTENDIVDIPNWTDVPDWAAKHPNLAGLYGAGKAILDPILEAGGLVVGGIAGAPAFGLGAVAGAGLGYGAAKEISKDIDILAGFKKPAPIGKQAVEAGKNILTGAGMEMGGQLLGKASSAVVKGGGKLYKAGKRVLSSAEVKAGKVLETERAISEPFNLNVKSAEKIQEQIPKLNLTYGQKSDFPPAVRGEAVTARKDNLGAILFKKFEAGNQSALKYYIRNKFPEQEGIDDVINVLKPKIDALKQNQSLTREMVDNLIADMPNITAEGIQQGGKTLRGTLNKAKLNTWKQSQELYGAIDDVAVDSSKLLQAMKDYEAAAIARGEAPFVIAPVSSIIKQLESGANTKNVWNAAEKQFTQEQFNNLSQLRGLRGQSYKIASGSTDYQLANNARQIGKIIDEGMEVEAQKIGGDFLTNFRTAQEFYNKEYVGKFRLGTVGNILKAGKDAASRYGKTDSEVIGEFFRGDKKGLERIGDLINALGKKNIQSMIRDYAAYDMKNSVISKVTGEVMPNKLAQWYSRYRGILKTAGIDREFFSIANAQKIADTTTLAITEFEKSMAGKMLGVDSNHAIKVAFKGKAGKDAGIVANELMGMVRGNKAAEKGLQGAFKDFLMQQVEMASKDVSGNAMLSSAKTSKVMNQYGNAIRTLWRSEPEKVKALYTFQEAVNILGRTKTSQFAGSQTSEYEQGLKAMESLPFMGYKGVVARFILRLEDFIGKQKINTLIIQGRFDPNFADHMIRMSKDFNKKRNFEFLKKSAERIESMLGLESGISGGKGEALGRALGAVGVKEIEKFQK